MSDTLLVGGRFLLLDDKEVGDTGGVIDLLVVNLRRVSKFIIYDEYKIIDILMRQLQTFNIINSLFVLNRETVILVL